MTKTLERKLTQEITALRAEFTAIIEKLDSAITSFNNNKDKFGGYSNLNKIQYNNGFIYDFYETYGSNFKLTVAYLKDKSILIEFKYFNHIYNMVETYTINFDPTTDTSDLTAYYYAKDYTGDFNTDITIDEFIKVLNNLSILYNNMFVENLK